MAKTPEEKEAERLATEKEEAELKAESDRVEAEKKAKDDAKKASKEAKASTSESEQVYTKSQVQAMLKQLAMDIKSQNGDNQDADDDEAYKQKKIRIPRFKNKFVTSLKNTNTDEYFPDLVIHAFDVWNEQLKRNDPWVTLVFEDDTTLTVPLHTALTKSSKVWVDLIEVISQDTSYVAGKVERQQVKDYSPTGTGVLVKQKVTQADYSYKVRMPDGKEVIVGKEVVNW
jgi:hypothetical protein